MKIKQRLGQICKILALPVVGINLVSVAIALVIGWWVPTKFLELSRTTLFQTIFTVFIYSLIVLFLFRHFKKIVWPTNEQLLVIVGLCLAVIIVLFDQASSEWQKVNSDLLIFQKNDRALKQEDTRSLYFVDGVLNDLKNNSSTVFWNDFWLFNYQQSSEHIRLYYSAECAEAYSAIMAGLDSINTLNKLSRDLILAPPIRAASTNLPSETLKIASSTKGHLETVKTSCAGVKQQFYPHGFKLPPGLSVTPSPK